MFKAKVFAKREALPRRKRALALENLISQQKRKALYNRQLLSTLLARCQDETSLMSIAQGLNGPLKDK